MTRLTRQEMGCPGDEGPCEARVVIELRGEYFLRSTSTELEQLAERAGWKRGFCPQHDYLGRAKELREKEEAARLANRCPK